ncbi:MAG TPA: ribosome maturation factor RimM [Actinomycetota bacterium]|nr:ribosome maturation factor RimM [Actinomycetota bacterium]
MPSAGRVGRPHGLDGHFHVTQPVAGLLEAGTPVVVGETATRVASRKGTDEQPIIRLEAAADRSAAVALRGQELVVERADAPALEEDEYWAEDLVGCRVIAGERVLGSVVELLALPSCEALELDSGVGPVPMVRDAIVRVDIEARAIFVDGEFLGAA